MSVSAPYCLSADVRAMLLFLGTIGSADFPTSGTAPIKSQVETLINQIASRIDMAYASVGYSIPFAAISGETWGSFQTSFLGYFNAIGVAALFATPANAPRVADMRARGGSGNRYLDEWEALIGSVRAIGRREEGEALVLLRASTRVGSAAEYLLSTPYPPLSDYLEGYRDPTLSDGLRDFTNRYREYHHYNRSQEESFASNPTSPEWLGWWHYRMGWTYSA